MELNKRASYWFLTCSSFYVAFIVLCLFTYTLNILENTSLVEFRHERLITIISLAYFCGLLLCSITSIRAFWFILPIVIITVPNAVNSVFPGFFLTHLGEKGNASFSFISHIDIYLITNFIVQSVNRKYSIKLKLDGFYLMAFLTLLLGIGLLYKSFEITINAQDFIFVLNGAFHFRYLFLILLFSYQLKDNAFEKAFIQGLLLAIPLLAVEAFSSTLLSGASLLGELKSGNFANNVFGNFLAFLFVFFLIINKNYCLNKFFYRTIQILLLCLVIMTGVRGAILSLFLGLLAYLVFVRITPFKIIYYFIISILIAVATITLLDLWPFIYYFADLFTSFQIVIDKGYGSEGIKIDSENSSLITRIAIWKGTFLMAVDNWFFGVGASQWNFLKKSYGIPFKVLLDPHNDYLNFFCLYGISGLIFIYCLYIKPMLYVFLNKLSKNINPYNIALFTLSVSSLTNANNSKHQVFIIVIIFLILSRLFEQKQSNLDQY
jgi:O-antigen ligase